MPKAVEQAGSFVVLDVVARPALCWQAILRRPNRGPNSIIAMNARLRHGGAFFSILFRAAPFPGWAFTGGNQATWGTMASTGGCRRNGAGERPIAIAAGRKSGVRGAACIFSLKIGGEWRYPGFKAPMASLPPSRRGAFHVFPPRRFSCPVARCGCLLLHRGASSSAGLLAVAEADPSRGLFLLVATAILE